jgi:hypothetical protein
LHSRPSPPSLTATRPVLGGPVPTGPHPDLTHRRFQPMPFPQDCFRWPVCVCMCVCVCACALARV